MEYKNLVEGSFIQRKNRFLAEVEIKGKKEEVFVPNTARCGELFQCGADILLEPKIPGTHRKTRFTLVFARKGQMWVNIDSQAPNILMDEYLSEHPVLPEIGRVEEFSREVQVGHSRLDFQLTGHGKGFLEVKGVSLEENGVCAFPDAPTQRGTRHIRLLTEMAQKGIPAFVGFVIQMEGMKLFKPNRVRDPLFAQALEEGRRAGVHILVKGISIEGRVQKIKKDVDYMLQPLILEQAHTEDIPKMLEWIEAGSLSLKIDGVDQWQRKKPDWMSLETDIKRQEAYLIQREGQKVGMATLLEEEEPTYKDSRAHFRYSGAYATIHRFTVSPEYRGQGIGRDSLVLLATLAREKGFSALRVDTHMKNVRMKSIIEQAGFEEAGLVAVADGDRIVYERCLQ